MGLTLVPWSDVMVFKISLQFKCVATLPCDVSLITIHASDCCRFSGINISQGSVATRVRYDRLFNDEFSVNLLPSRRVKKS